MRNPHRYMAGFSAVQNTTRICLWKECISGEAMTAPSPRLCMCLGDWGPDFKAGNKATQNLENDRPVLANVKISNYGVQMAKFKEVVVFRHRIWLAIDQ